MSIVGRIKARLVSRFLAPAEPAPPAVYRCCLAWRTTDASYYLHRVRDHGEGQA